MKALVVLVVIGLIILSIFGMYISTKNTLVQKNEAVKNQWAQVDVALQRRADLIPNLVETVKGYAQQEVTVFGDIANARAACSAPIRRRTRSPPTDNSMALSDGYWPWSRTIRNCVPTKISCACRMNLPAPKIASPSSAADTTTCCRTTTPTSDSSPASLFAGRAGFHRNDAYFQASEASRAVPKVQFTPPASQAAPAH